MRIVPIEVAQTNLSRLIEAACQGEEIIIARGQEPVIRLVPIEGIPRKRRLGALCGQLTVDDSFFEPLPAAELEAWEC